MLNIGTMRLFFFKKKSTSCCSRLHIIIVWAFSFFVGQTGNLTNCLGGGFSPAIIHEEIHHFQRRLRIYSSSNLLWFKTLWDTQLPQLHPGDLCSQHENLIPVCPQQACVCVCVWQNAMKGRLIEARTACFSQCHKTGQWSDCSLKGPFTQN